MARSDLSSNHEREGSVVSLGGRWRALVFTGTEWGSFATHHRRNEHDALTTVDSRRAMTTDVLRSEAAADVKHNGGAARGSARRRSSIAAVRQRAASVANVGAKMATSVAQVGCLAQRLKGNMSHWDRALETTLERQKSRSPRSVGCFGAALEQATCCIWIGRRKPQSTKTENSLSSRVVVRFL